MEKPHRSYSQVHTWLHCGWQYRLTKVKRYPERPSVWLCGGKAVHTVTEIFDHAVETSDLTIADVAKDDWNAAFAEAFAREVQDQLDKYPDVDVETWRTAGRKTKDKPRGEDILWWEAAGQEFVQNYIAWRVANADRYRIARTAAGEPAIELEVTLPLGGVKMKGYIDRVFEAVNTGGLLVVDLKSGTRMPFGPLQLATYALQAEKAMGAPIRWGAFFDCRKGSLSEPLIDLSGYDQNVVGQVYRTFDRAITQGIYLPNVDSHCKSCAVRDLCIYQGGSEPALSTD